MRTHTRASGVYTHRRNVRQLGVGSGRNWGGSPNVGLGPGQYTGEAVNWPVLRHFFCLFFFLMNYGVFIRLCVLFTILI